MHPHELVCVASYNRRLVYYYYSLLHTSATIIAPLLLTLVLQVRWPRKGNNSYGHRQTRYAK